LTKQEMRFFRINLVGLNLGVMLIPSMALTPRLEAQNNPVTHSSTSRWESSQTGSRPTKSEERKIPRRAGVPAARRDHRSTREYGIRGWGNCNYRWPARGCPTDVEYFKWLDAQNRLEFLYLVRMRCARGRAAWRHEWIECTL
jgi:hypothetical protein